jgi:hypothetical protein
MAARFHLIVLFRQIVNLSAYTPDSQYSQHIMPLMNLNPGARQRHQIRVINVGCFRMLKSMQTYRVSEQARVPNPTFSPFHLDRSSRRRLKSLLF